jgi:hypothetical protein
VNNYWGIILPAAVVALIFYLACSATIGTYFKAKEGYINRLFDKLKGASNGKE